MKIAKRKSKKGIINGAIKLLSDKDHWQIGYMATNADGIATIPEDPEAVKFCALGALRACSIDEDHFCETAECVNKVFKAETGGHGVVSINDGYFSPSSVTPKGYDAVMALLKVAAKKCR